MRCRTNSIRRAYPYQFQSPHIHFLRNGFNFSNDVTGITACEITVGLWLCYFILCLVTTNQRNLPGRLCHALLRYPRSNGIQSRCESGSSGKGIQWKNQLS